MWKGVLYLEEIVYSQNDNRRESKTQKEIRAAATSVLSDLSWNLTQIARETYAVALNANWSPSDPELRNLAFILYGHPLTTVFHLENMFNHILTVIRRLRKNLSMNKLLAVIYMQFTLTVKHSPFPNAGLHCFWTLAKGVP